jgi:hypothetical protein
MLTHAMLLWVLLHVWSWQNVLCLAECPLPRHLQPNSIVWLCCWLLADRTMPPGCRYTSQASEDACSIAFHLHVQPSTAKTGAVPGPLGSQQTDSVVQGVAKLASTTANMVERTGKVADPVLAAYGSRHPSGKWKYVGDSSFVTAPEKPWSDLGLKTFQATNRAGVLNWLKWIVEHTPGNHAAGPGRGGGEAASSRVAPSSPMRA